MDLHFISTGEDFPYPYFLAIQSALVAHNMEKAHLWVTEQSTGKYFEAIRERVDLRPLSPPNLPALEGKPDAFKRPHLKDYLQWKILSEHGGIYLDLDTFSIADIAHHIGDKEVVGFLYGSLGSVGDCPDPFESAVVVAQPNSPILQDVFNEATSLLSAQGGEFRWGETSPILWSRHLKANLDRVAISHSLSHGGDNCQELYQADTELKDGARIIHLYAKAYSQEFSLIDEDYIEAGDSLYARTVRRALPRSLRRPLSVKYWMNARGAHYGAMFDTLQEKPCRNIMEIGTHDGDNALLMIHEAAKCVPESEIRYFGFDLFEELTPATAGLELSFPQSPPVASVEKRLCRHTDAQINLVKGNTHQTLPSDALPQMDYIYIDGGHSIETIQHDWEAIKPLLKSSTVVYLDDYYPQLPFAGCKFLADAISQEDFTVEILPQTDQYPQPWGQLAIQLMRVRPCPQPLRYPVAIRNQQAQSEITVTITSCGRFDLLRRTIGSLLATVGQPVKIALIDDSEDEGEHQRIIVEYGDRFDIYIFGQARGQAWCLDYLYNVVDTPYIFHCEDDWEFIKPGYLQQALEIIGEDENVLAVSFIGGREEASLYGLVGPEHITLAGIKYYERLKWWRGDELGYWYGWAGQPCLKRRADWIQMGMFQNTQTEAEYDATRFNDYGKKTVWLEEGYANHIGEGRGLYQGGAQVTWLEPMWRKKRDLAQALMAQIRREELPPAEQRGTNYRFHMLGIAHVPTHPDVNACAYTQKIVKLCKMLKGLGHTVYFYGVEGSEVECDENITVVSQDTLRKVYGEYDWRSEFFKFDQNDEAFQTFNRNAISEINQRKGPRDFLLCPFGHADKPIADAVGLMAVETGIGYYGFFSNYRVWESYAWMHLNYGRMGQNDGSWYDAVIPNYFDPEQFEFQEEKEDWFLYLGRLTQRKGVDVAVQVTRELGAKLKVAGQGSLVSPQEQLNITDSHVEFLGYADVQKRKELLSRARALFVPTYYIEPFGGVAVEASLSGTPVITTDWGAFSETVLHGITGYRCRTFDDFLWAARNVGMINPWDCHKWATLNYSMDRVARMYQEYFNKLYDLYGAGWYEKHPERSELDWLVKEYP